MRTYDMYVFYPQNKTSCGIDEDGLTKFLYENRETHCCGTWRRLHTMHAQWMYIPWDIKIKLILKSNLISASYNKNEIILSNTLEHSPNLLSELIALRSYNKVVGFLYKKQYFPRSVYHQGTAIFYQIDAYDNILTSIQQRQINAFCDYFAPKTIKNNIGPYDLQKVPIISYGINDEMILTK